MFNREFRRLDELRKHFVSNREMTLIVMDEGDSGHSLESYKPIPYNALVVFERSVGLVSMP